MMKSSQQLKHWAHCHSLQQPRTQLWACCNYIWLQNNGLLVFLVTIQNVLVAVYTQFFFSFQIFNVDEVHLRSTSCFNQHKHVKISVSISFEGVFDCSEEVSYSSRSLPTVGKQRPLWTPNCFLTAAYRSWRYAPRQQQWNLLPELQCSWWQERTINSRKQWWHRERERAWEP